MSIALERVLMLQCASTLLVGHQEEHLACNVGQRWTLSVINCMTQSRRSNVDRHRYRDFSKCCGFFCTSCVQQIRNKSK